MDSVDMPTVDLSAIGFNIDTEYRVGDNCMTFSHKTLREENRPKLPLMVQIWAVTSRKPGYVVLDGYSLNFYTYRHSVQNRIIPDLAPFTVISALADMVGFPPAVSYMRDKKISSLLEKEYL